MDTSANIFTPGIYHGSPNPDYHTQKVAAATVDEVVRLVTKRAQEDGQFCIDNNLVGDNEDKMRKMVEYVCNVPRIHARIVAAVQENRTIDFLCRDLANGSKWSK